MLSWCSFPSICSKSTASETTSVTTPVTTSTREITETPTEVHVPQSVPHFKYFKNTPLESSNPSNPVFAFLK